MLHKLLLMICGVLFSFSIYSQENIKITAEKNNDNSVTFRYEKFAAGTYTINIEFLNLQNTLASNYQGTVKKDNGVLFRLTPIDKKRSIAYSYKSRYSKGHVNPKVDSLFVYVLPFPEGDTIFVKEAGYAREKYLGEEKPTNFKSYAFYSNTKDTVCAIRKGIVVGVVDEYEYNEDSLKNIKFTSKKNAIQIEHEDGTIAGYSNFKKGKIFVSEGDEVLPQVPLGCVNKSPNTDRYFLSFAVYYATRSSPAEKKEQKYLDPYFITEDGVMQLAPKKEYVVVVNEEILNKELDKKKKKKKEKQSK